MNKLPFKIKISGGYWVVSNDGKTIICQANGMQDAEYIVKACNLYPELIELSKLVSDGNFNHKDVIDKARELLKRTKE